MTDPLISHHFFALPKAPRRFQIIAENTCIGKPSVPYGIIRRLAHHQRKLLKEPYLRLQYFDAGRKGDPLGGLRLEVNGELFHFSGGVKRWRELHDHAGNLTPAGERALARGMPALLSTSCDWRWVQDEVDLSSIMVPSAIAEIGDHFQRLLEKKTALPFFQSRTWAHHLQARIDPQYHNCTTIILEQLRQKAGLFIEHETPLGALDAIQEAVGSARSELDDQLNYFLSVGEDELAALLKMLDPYGGDMDWEQYARGTGLLPTWLKWNSLISVLLAGSVS